MPKSAGAEITTIGIDIGKNSFHVVGRDKRGAIVLRHKLSRGQLEACRAALSACVGAHHLARKLTGSTTTLG